MDMKTSDTEEDLVFPDGWASHPPPPQLSNDEYAKWIREQLKWLPPQRPGEKSTFGNSKPVNVMFEL
jgi:hypothetical protein